jgi:DNA-binding beta-propeller fold protein YncE
MIKKLACYTPKWLVTGSKWYLGGAVVLTTILWFIVSCCLYSCAPSKIASSLPDAAIAVNTVDCVWVLDGNRTAIAYGPLCLSTILQKVNIGDVEIDANGFVYISLTYVWRPEKELGDVVTVWDPTTDEVSEIKVPSGSHMLAIDDNRKLLYVTSRGQHVVSKIDLHTHQVIDELELEIPSFYENDIAVGPGGELYVAAWKDLLALNPEPSLAVRSSRKFESGIKGMVIREDGDIYVIFDTVVELVRAADLTTVAQRQFKSSNLTDYFLLPSENLVFVTDLSTLTMFEFEEGITTTVSIPGESWKIIGAQEEKVYLLSTNERTVLAVNTGTGEFSEPIHLPRR